MQRQVITVSPVGVISGLQRKPGQGVDLRAFGRAKIDRVSDIKFDEVEQHYRIDFLTGLFAGKTLDAGLWWDQTNSIVVPNEIHEDLKRDTKLLFAEYDDAVTVEVLFLDAARRRGNF